MGPQTLRDSGKGICMAGSGIQWIDVTFDWCVRLLYSVANAIGITYEEINVWLFVIILPLMLLASISLNCWLIWGQLKRPNGKPVA